MFQKSKKRFKEVRLTCPFCGGEQNEPELAVSSFCRSCGGHFRIEKGEAIAPPGSHISGITIKVREHGEDKDRDDDKKDSSDEKNADAEEAPTPPKNEPTWFGKLRQKSIEEKRAAFTEKTQPIQPLKKETESKAPDEKEEAPEQKTEEPAKSKPAAKTERPAKKKTAAKKKTPAKKKSAAKEKPEAPKEEAEEEVEVDPSKLGAAAQPVEQLKEGSMAALLGGAIDKLKAVDDSPPPPAPKMPRTFVPAGRKKSGADPRKRPVRCFECNHLQMVSESAASTQCARCSVYIRLVDHEITSKWSQTIRTRGNVHVQRKGSIIGCDIACHDLIVQGDFSASVDCSGDATFRHSAKVIGNMYCKHLFVDKKCEVDFPQGLIAESADIHGTIRGNMTCSGKIEIFKTGSVIGDATARAVVLKDGGVLTGNMSIQPDLEIKLPEKKGYLKDMHGRR